MKKLLVCFLSIIAFVILTVQQVSGQTNPNDPRENFADQIIPPSPEASLLHKYQETPVSHYTGIPDIKVPLLELSDGDLSLPIYLSYHAGGNKVESVASYVGLGWSLISGGTISRVVQGLPDDEEGGFLQFIKKDGVSYEYLVSGDDSRWVYLQLIAEGCEDAQPDEFYFNFNGVSGKFAFDWEGNLVVSSNVKLKVTPNFEGNDPEMPIVGWEIVTGDGTIYKFLTIDETTINSYSLSCSAVQEFASSWYLTEVVDVNQQNWIKFEYDNYPQTLSFEASDMIVHAKHPKGSDGPEADCGNIGGQRIANKTSLRYSGKIPSRIFTGRGMELVFNALTPREDLDDINQPVINSLDEILYLDFEGNTVKDFKLRFDYSSGRLTLKKLIEKAESDSIERHQFSYNEVPLPKRDSKAQDHWGYYNGANNDYLVPPATLEFGFGTKYFSGADRNPQPDQMKAGILEKITYPTAGYTEFEYEPHTYIFENFAEIVEYRDTTMTDGLYVTGKCDVNTCDVHSDYDGWEEKSFEIKGLNEADTALVKIHYQTWVYTDDYFGAQRSPKIELVDEGGNILWGITKTESYGNTVITLYPGKYKLRARAYWKSGYSYDLAKVNIEWQEISDQLKKRKIAGGLRVKSISDYSNFGEAPLVRTFHYDLEDGRSSGVIYSEPEYVYEHQRYVMYDEFIDTKCEMYYRLARNVSVLGSTQGSHIGYQKVKVTSGGDTKNGYLVRRYTSPLEYSDAIAGYPPFPPPTSYSYKTGLPKSEELFKTNGEEFILTQMDTNAYNFKEATIRGLKVGFQGGNNDESRLFKYDLGKYSLVLGHSQVQTVHEKKFSETNEVLEKITTIEYDSEQQNVIKQQIMDSNSGAINTEFFYPQDYKLLSSTHPVYKMKEKGMTALPIEIVASTGVASPSVLTGRLFEYKLTDNLINLQNIYELEAGQPLSDFEYSVNKSSNITKSYPKDASSSYKKWDSKGNLLEYFKREGEYAFVWGYNKVYPIGKVENATEGEVFYTSFEEPGEGNIEGNAKTGRKSFSGSYVVHLPEVPGEYELSYWIFENGKWEGRYETISADKTLTGHIDEVRIHPKDALMTTYTYKPGVGLTSQTNPSGITTYYEYDGFNRLEYVRDDNNNIIKAYEYKYKHSQPASLKGEIGYSPVSVYVGEEVAFEVVGEENNPSDAVYLWEIDGVQYQGTGDILHTFTQKGTYVVNLTITHPAYDSYQASKTITVNQLSSADLTVVNETSNPGELIVDLKVEPDAESNNMEYQLEYKASGASTFELYGTFPSNTFDARFTNSSFSTNKNVTLRCKVLDNAGTYVYTNNLIVTVLSISSNQ